MAEFNLPTNLSNIWASAGDILKPSDTKILQGWSPEIPPRQWFNWLDNRQDQAIAHIAQHGVPSWTSDIEYRALKSYVQGSDGAVYQAQTTNTNINPTTDNGTNWKVAFLNTASFTGNNRSFGPDRQHQILPSGLIINTGTYTHVNGTSTVTFSKPFTTQVFSVVVSDVGAVNWSTTSVTTNGVASITLSGFTGRSFTWNGNGFIAGNGNCSFTAIGY